MCKQDILDKNYTEVKEVVCENCNATVTVNVRGKQRRVDKYLIITEERFLCPKCHQLSMNATERTIL